MIDYLQRLQTSMDPLTAQSQTLSHEEINALPVVDKLKRAFIAVIPPRFHQRVNFEVAPPVPGMKHTIVAKCSEGECRTRAAIHVLRDASNQLVFDEKDETGQPTPHFDRLDPALCCDECQKLIAQPQ